MACHKLACDGRTHEMLTLYNPPKSVPLSSHGTFASECSFCRAPRDRCYTRPHYGIAGGRAVCCARHKKLGMVRALKETTIKQGDESARYGEKDLTVFTYRTRVVTSFVFSSVHECTNTSLARLYLMCCRRKATVQTRTIRTTVEVMFCRLHDSRYYRS